MTEKLKYKVGDKVLIEAEIHMRNTDNMSYSLRLPKGKFISWFTEEELRDNAVHLPPRPKVIPAVMDWYEEYKDDNGDIRVYLRHCPEELENWLRYGPDKLKNQHALATLIAYGEKAVEVEKEKKYRVKFKGSDQYLRRVAFSNKFEFHEAFPDYLTKQELIDAGFEGVFDNPMFEVEEVE